MFKFALKIITIIYLFWPLGPNSWLRAQGRDYWPEYRSFGPMSPSSIEGPDLIDSESASDLLTYTQPVEWISRWMGQDRGFDLSVGSISSKRFKLSENLKFHSRWNSQTEFRFSHFRQGDFLNDQDHNILELIRWLDPAWGLAVYGELSSKKSEDDFGVALLFKPIPESEWRSYHSWIDFSRNERNLDDDRFSRAPRTWGSIFRSWKGRNYNRIGFHVETPVEWRFPSQSFIYKASRKTIFVSQTVSILPFSSAEKTSQSQRLETEFHWEASFTSQWEEKLSSNSVLQLNKSRLTQEGTPAAKFKDFSASPADNLVKYSTHSEAWKRDEISLRIEKGFWLSRWFKSPDAIQLGLQAVQRQWTSPLLPNVETTDILPYVWWNFHRHWSTGYELTWHQRKDEVISVLSPSMETTSKVEHRWNLVYRHYFASDTELRVLFTADLDRFGTTETWEGGSVQMRSHF